MKRDRPPCSFKGCGSESASSLLGTPLCRTHLRAVAIAREEELADAEARKHERERPSRRKDPRECEDCGCIRHHPVGPVCDDCRSGRRFNRGIGGYKPPGVEQDVDGFCGSWANGIREIEDPGTNRL